MMMEEQTKCNLLLLCRSWTWNNSQEGWILAVFILVRYFLQSSAEFQFVFKLKGFVVLHIQLSLLSNCTPSSAWKKKRNVEVWNWESLGALCAHLSYRLFPIPCVLCMWVPSCVVNTFGHRPLREGFKTSKQPLIHTLTIINSVHMCT